MPINIYMYLYLIIFDWSRGIQWILVLTAIAIKVGCQENRPGSVKKIKSVFKKLPVLYT